MAELILFADQVEESPVDWAIDGWFAKGEMTLLAGVPKIGKSTVVMKIASAFTTGGEVLSGLPTLVKGKVLMWSGEDSLDVMKGRAVMSGADLARLGFVSEFEEGGKKIPFDPSLHFSRLAEAIMEIKPVALVMEPITKLVRSSKDLSADPNAIRNALVPVIDLCRKLKIVFIAIAHFAKATQGKDVMDRVYGSHVFSALPRMILACLKGKKGQSNVLVRVASNIAPSEGGFEYSLVQGSYECPRGRIESQHAVFGSYVDGEAQELADEREGTFKGYESKARTSLLEEAMNVWQTLLSEYNNKIPSFEVANAEKQLSISHGTMMNAKEKLGLMSVKEGKTWWTYDPSANLKP